MNRTNSHDALLEKAIQVTTDNKAETLKGLPLTFILVCNILLKLRSGSLIVILPDGRALKFIGDQATQNIGIIKVNQYGFAFRAIMGGDIGFFESYLDGDWETPDLTACLFVFAMNADHIESAFEAIPMISWLDAARHWLNRNTIIGSRKNIMSHYDLSNEFYKEWLDPSMTYSAAIFPHQGADLETAQENKYRSLAEKIDLKPDDKILEIGSGWGGFAEYTAKNIGANLTGITISQEQYEYSKKRIFKAGLNEKVDIQLCDYRNIEGTFDKVASIEMFEAVGKQYWPVYFKKISESLKSDGLAGFQIITIADRFYKTYERSTDFIQRYVFPGGMLASPPLLRQNIEDNGLAWQNSQQFGVHYADTLKNWHARFLNAWEDIELYGFTTRFKKLWQFYFSYCEAGFRAGTTDVYQISAKKI